MGVSSTEIKYSNVTLNGNDIIHLFPNLGVYSQEDTFDMLLIYHYLTENGTDYVVLGKFRPDDIPTSKDSTYIKWLCDLKLLLQGSLESIKEYLKQLNMLRQSPEMERILFTQEGYDLISGKFFFTQEGTIQRTVAVDNGMNQGELMFGQYYAPVNEEHKMKHLELFDTWDNFEKKYFLNTGDLGCMTPGDLALLYAVLNKDKLFSYMRDNHRGWTMKHNLEMGKNSPDEVANLSLQLLDVVTDFQLEQTEEVVKNK